MVRIDNEKCSGCGGCVDACGNEVLAMDGIRVVVEDPDECEECGACERACPCDAITVEEE